MLRVKIKFKDNTEVVHGDAMGTWPESQFMVVNLTDNERVYYPSADISRVYVKDLNPPMHMEYTGGTLASAAVPATHPVGATLI